jgi:hypothetical protein
MDFAQASNKLPLSIHQPWAARMHGRRFFLLLLIPPALWTSRRRAKETRQSQRGRAGDWHLTRSFQNERLSRQRGRYDLPSRKLTPAAQLWPIIESLQTNIGIQTSAILPSIQGPRTLPCQRYPLRRRSLDSIFKPGSR